MPPLRGIMSDVKDRRDNVKPGRFCVLHSYFGGGSDILVCLNVGRSPRKRRPRHYNADHGLVLGVGGVSGPERANKRQMQATSTTLDVSQIRTRAIIFRRSRA
jgi:hypothetical protein